MRTLRTRRLRLDPIGPENLPFLADLDGDAAVLRHLQPRARTREEALAHWSPRVPGPMWVGDLGERPVGWWALWPDEGGETAELGYRLARRWWRQGLAVEGARAVLDDGFADTRLQVVRAETMVVNAGSRGVMRRLGMREVRIEVREWEEPLLGADLGEVITEITRAQRLAADQPEASTPS
ncbi:N-acetyltransferase [Janibacter hoylei PVAS-1]|nr:GNAT family N-acetyltransferase [Janibacter hoylei]RWU83858.1 N-acetyltransferase [Janibacter hoylei PVAS-1]